MRQRGAGPVGRYGLETVAPVAGNLRPEGLQLAGGFPFVHLPHLAFQPVQELLHREAVFQVRLPHAFDLHAVLDRLAERHGRQAFHHVVAILVQGVADLEVERARIHENAVHVIVRIGGQRKDRLAVVADGHLVGR